MTNTENTPETRIGESFAALKASEAEMAAAVAAARAAGSSWASIGRVLGITKQAAQQRFGSAAE
ncbi:UNVERIFIED_ORG: hypothetical protein ABID57_003807 [Arthrobacter sp. UYEF1]